MQRSILRFAAALAIRPGEGRVVLLLLVHSFCIGIARIFTLSAGYALFLAEFDAQTLPYIYIGVTLAVTASAFLLLKLGERISFISVLGVNLAFLLACLLFFRIALSQPGLGWLVIGLPIFYDVLWALSNLETGALMGRLLTLRQGKRLFGLVEAGEGLATIAGGFLVPVLAAALGTLNLLVVAAAGVGGALVLLFVIARVFAGWLVLAPDEADEITGTTRVSLLKNRYVLLIFALAGLAGLTYYFLDSAFYDSASAHYNDAQLAGFLGLFYAACELLNMLSRTLISGRLLSKYGLSFGLLIQPVLIGISGLAVVGAGLLPAAPVLLFWLVALTKLFDTITSEDIGKATAMLVYQPLAPPERLRAQTFVDGGVTPIATGLAGVGLLVFNSVLHPDLVQRFGFLLGLIACWIVVAIWLGRAYLGVLIGALTRQRLGDGTLPALDESSLALLRHQLDNPHQGAVLFVLNALDSQSDASLSPLLAASLGHPAPEVRLDALRRIERRRLTAALPAVELLLASESSPTVCGAALCALVAIGGGAAAERVTAYLDERPILLGALVGLLRWGDQRTQAIAAGRVFQLAESPAPADRALAAMAIGAAPGLDSAQPLLRLLGDPDLPVVLAALAAARTARHSALWPAVVNAVALPDLRDEALAVLVAAGADALPAIGAALARAGLRHSVRIRLLKVCGRIGTPDAQQLLLEQIGAPDADLRHQVLLALSSCGYRATGLAVATVRRLIDAETAQATWALATLVDTGDDAPVALLRGALQRLSEQSHDRLLLLLSLLYDGPALARAREHINSHSAAKQAYAQEIVDILLPKALKATVLPLLDDVEPADRLRQLDATSATLLGRPARLIQIVERSSTECPAWIKACALHAISALATPELAEIVRAARGAGEPLVRESAEWVWLRIQPAATSQRRGALAQRTRGAARDWIEGGSVMLSTLEKVLILKTVDMFSTTPENVLFELAVLLKEVELPADATLFDQGDPGDCMYIIVDGQVRVHDHGRLLNYLGERDVFGEMAVLDTEPRVASVTAVDATLLLRLDQAALYELMADRMEVVRGIIYTLSRRIRYLVSAGALAEQRTGQIPAD